MIEEEAEEDIRALGGVTRDEELSELGVDHRARPVQLAAGQPGDRVPGVLGDRPVRGSAGEDGGAGGAGADRRQPGRQCRHADHDGGGARAGDARTRPTPMPGASIVRELLVGLLNGLAFAVITGVAACAWFQVPDLGIVIGAGDGLQSARGGASAASSFRWCCTGFASIRRSSSGVFVTTVTDVVGFFSFLGIATLWFGLK